MFDIEALQPTNPNSCTTKGRIQLGDFSETFQCVLEFWNVENYRRHWRAAVRRILDGTPKSCLITSLTDPESANFVFWWPLYYLGEFVAVQNHVLFLDELSGQFDPVLPYDHVRDRETMSEDGQPVSEWLVPVRSLQSWLDSKSAQT